LTCEHGHEYPVVDGIPVLLLDDKQQTIEIAQASLAAASQFAKGLPPVDPLFTSTLGISEDEREGVLAESGESSYIDPVVRFMIGATNGLLYKRLTGIVAEYTIPELRLPPAKGRRLLDVGCNWGRWSVAASRLGYRAVGIDPSLGAVLAARRVTRQLDAAADFVVGDARFLPFADDSFDTVFSYSVLQHFSKEDACLAISEIGRVLKRESKCLVQMPNKWGLRCLFHQVRRRFRVPVGFEVRYWTLAELLQTYSSRIGPTRLLVDCFFGLGLQASDSHLMPLGRRCVITASEVLRHLSRRLPGLTTVADSVYVASVKAPVNAP
jgi:SAM-dependent methyltransferase